MVDKYRDRIAKVLMIAREQAGVSQRELARRLKKSTRTIQTRETGESPVSFSDFLGTMNALNVHPWPYFFQIVYPKLFATKTADIEVKRQRIVQYFELDATPYEIETIDYLLNGFHGGSWIGLITEWLANSHCSMEHRLIVGKLVETNYDIDKKMGNLRDMDNIQPDIEILKSCVDAAFLSVVSGGIEYFAPPPDDDEEMSYAQNI